MSSAIIFAPGCDDLQESRLPAVGWRWSLYKTPPKAQKCNQTIAVFLHSTWQLLFMFSFNYTHYVYILIHICKFAYLCIRACTYIGRERETERKERLSQHFCQKITKIYQNLLLWMKNPGPGWVTLVIIIIIIESKVFCLMMIIKCY